MVKSTKILSHYILSDGVIYKNTILEINNDNINFIPFEQETANTTFVSGIIMLCNSECSEQHFAQISHITSINNDIICKVEAINEYLIINNLYAKNREDVMLISIRNGVCDRISI